MASHQENIKNLRNIVIYLNSLNEIKTKIPSDKSNIKDLYRGILYVINTIIFIVKTLKRKDINLEKKTHIISRIKDKRGDKIFTIIETNRLVNNFVKQTGGTIPSDNPIKHDSWIYFIGDLENRIGLMATLPLEILSSFNSFASFICAMITSTLGYPPFSWPPISLVVSLPKLILRISKLLILFGNIFLNISRRRWSTVVKNGLALFPQFLIMENAASTQIIGVNRILALVNKVLNKVPSKDKWGSELNEFRQQQVLDKYHESRINFDKKISSHK